jgi:hypothetical protein
VEETVHSPPDEAGVDATALTPALVQYRLEARATSIPPDTSDITVRSGTSKRRYLPDERVSVCPTVRALRRRTTAEAGDDEQEWCHDELEKTCAGRGA